MDKLELRLDAAQCDLICYALGMARDASLSRQHKDEFGALRSWIRHRRVKRWGDEWADKVSSAINVDVASGAH